MLSVSEQKRIDSFFKAMFMMRQNGAQFCKHFEFGLKSQNLCRCPGLYYFKAIKTVPPIINKAPNTLFNVNIYLKKED